MPAPYTGNPSGIQPHDPVEIQVPVSLDPFDAPAFITPMTKLADVAAYLQQNGALLNEFNDFAVACRFLMGLDAKQEAFFRKYRRQSKSDKPPYEEEERRSYRKRGTYR